MPCLFLKSRIHYTFDYLIPFNNNPKDKLLIHTPIHSCAQVIVPILPYYP